MDFTTSSKWDAVHDLDSGPLIIDRAVMPPARIDRAMGDLHRDPHLVVRIGGPDMSWGAGRLEGSSND